MKLSDHVDKIRNLITASFDKQFARLGIGANKQIELEKLPEQVRGKRQHLEIMLENHIGETGCYQDAREKLLDELSFTLFNRLAAVKVMESANLFPPVITKQAEHGGRSFGHKAWLEEFPENRGSELEGIRDYFKYAFNELGDSLPLYSKLYPYALLPDTISLNEIVETFNVIAEDSQIEDEIWQSDDVLGWLYESYNNAKKQAFKDSKEKTEYDKVSLQSQVYTPRWVVQFLVENSLGKLYLEMYPESDIKNQFKIANAPKTQERDPKPLHEIKLIDPASGSGNFLLYAFDFFYALYIDQIENYDADYDEDDIPKLIIENNLHGIDLDDRAIQLAQLGLYIKARKKRRFIKGSFNFKVVSSDFYLPAYDDARHIFEDGGNLDNTQKELIEDIWNDLRYAYKFGSLIRLDEKLKAKLKELEAKQGSKVLDMFADADIREQKDFTEKFFNNLKAAVEQFTSKSADTFIASKTRDAITFLELLTTEYDVACANPPYTDSGDFGTVLKKFIESNYKKPHKFSTNLYAAFIKRCYELTNKNGKIAMIHPHTFMFIKTFEDVRTFMIDKCHIDIMVDFGLDRVNLFGPGVLLDATFYILSKDHRNEEGLYFNLSSNLQEKYKKGRFLESLESNISGVNEEPVHSLEQSKLKVIKSWPFIYWISDEFRDKFSQATFKSKTKVAEGLTTANNERFLRYWWEVKSDNSSDKWFTYSKGGPYCKYWGNMWTVVNWKNDGVEVKSNKGASVRNKDFYFKDGITYSSSGSKGPSFRLLEENSIFDSGSRSIFPTNIDDIPFILGVLNSKLISYTIDCLNPTVNTTVGDIERLPYIKKHSPFKAKIAKLVEQNISFRKNINEYILYEKNFVSSPFLKFKKQDMALSLKEYLNYENLLNTASLINESIINSFVFELYGVTEEDKSIVNLNKGESVANLPISQEALDSYIAEIKTSNIKHPKYVEDYLSNLPKIAFDIDEKVQLEEGFDSLYQKNNSFEEYCISKNINPINIWYLFKNIRIPPKQRKNKVALEYIVALVNDLLIEDEDGIIPLVPNSGEKTIIQRVEEAFDKQGFSSAEFSKFDSLLNMPLNEFLNKKFFSKLTEHLNLFMYMPKAPFIWHLTSGPEQGFDCYISIYKWSRDNLMRIRSVYIEHRERALINRQSDLANNESVDAQNEKDKISKQLKEIESFKVKIDELLEEGYNPIIDDGVGKNIAPLQKKKMISYDVLNAGQLKKYLNADW
jgi:hypothetical protein